MTLASGGVRCSRLWSPASFSVHLASSAVTPAGSVHNPGRQCGVYVGAVEEMMCVVCVDVTEGHSGDGCVLA